MHDASEAYCGDVSSPLKRLIPQYRKIEDGVQEAIANYFGLAYPFPPEIHTADKLAYVTERQTISNTGKDVLWFTDVVPAELEIRGLVPSSAYKLFMERYEEVTRNGQGYEKLRRKTAA